MHSISRWPKTSQQPTLDSRYGQTWRLSVFSRPSVFRYLLPSLAGLACRNERAHNIRTKVPLLGTQFFCRMGSRWVLQTFWSCLQCRGCLAPRYFSHTVRLLCESCCVSPEVGDEVRKSRLTVLLRPEYSMTRLGEAINAAFEQIPISFFMLNCSASHANRLLSYSR